MDVVSVDLDNEDLDSSFEEISLLYPSDSLNQIHIKQADLDRLEPEEFLNDTIVDFALRFYIDTLGNQKFYAFNSFFYKALSQNGYAKVMSWNSKINIFEKDYLLIPIFGEEHWSLAVVCYPLHLFFARSPQPALLYFDSLGLSNAQVKCLIVEFLLCEWSSKLGCVPELVQDLGLFFPKVPKQDNCSDCGVFLIEYSKFFIENPHYFDQVEGQVKDCPEMFSQETIENSRQVLKSKILNIWFFGTVEEGFVT